MMAEWVRCVGKSEDGAAEQMRAELRTSFAQTHSPLVASVTAWSREWGMGRGQKQHKFQCS
jgi:hypothetical protein